MLSDNIALGTEFEVDPSLEDNFTLICGGCGEHLRIRGIWVEKRAHSAGGYLPKAIFDLPDPDGEKAVIE